MDKSLEELVEMFKGLIPLSDNPEALKEAVGDELEGLDRDTYTQAIDQVMQEIGVPETEQGHYGDQLDAADDYSPEGLLAHLTTVLNAPQVTTTVDQGLDIHGTVHRDVHQANDSTVANALGEGAIAGEEVLGNQLQTGDGQQVGGDSGVQNQGNNSGQQAGWSAEADNVTTGDNNTVGSDWASRVGAEQVSQDGAYINDSAQAFGEGSATNEANDSYDSHDSFTFEASATDSFNNEWVDLDSATQTIDIDGRDGYGLLEPVHPHGEYHLDPHVDVDLDVISQEAEILD